MEDVRKPGVGSGAVRDPIRVATFFQNAYWLAGVRSALGDALVEIPRTFRPNVPELPREASFAFLGKDVTAGVEAEADTLREMLSKALGTYDWVHETKPDAIAVWTDEYPEQRAACIAAKELGIPAVEVRHGATHPYKHGHWGATKYASHTCGSWEYRDWHRFYGLPGEVIATGAVTQDPYAKIRVGDVQLTARYELKIPIEVPVVCFLTDAVFSRSAWQDYGLAYGKAVEFFKAFRMLQEIIFGVQLIVKVHPQERNPRGKKVSAKDYEFMLAECGVTKDYSVVEDPLALALGASDVVVGAQSTAMASALLMGIPCVVFGYEPFFPVHAFEGRGCVVARRPQDVLEQLTELLIGDGPLMGRLLGETQRGGLYFGSDGSAAWRVARVIERLARGEEVDESCWGTVPEKALA